MHAAVEGKLEATRGAAAAGRHATAAFGEALARVFGVEQCVELRDSVSSRDERELALAVVADSGEAAVFGFDKAGAARLLTTLLRSGALAREAVTQNPPALEQALGAALAREAAVALGVAVRYDPAALRRRWTHRAEAWVHLDDGLTRVALSVALPEEPLLAGSRLLLPIIVALSAAPRAELARLAPGDLWLPDSGWLLSPERLGERSALEGRALLGAPSGAEGLWLVLSGETALVTGPRVGLDAVCGLDSAGAPPPAPDDDREAWARVHVELGHVELELAEAAMLRAGSRLALMRTSLLKLCVEGIPRARGAFETTEHGQGLRIEELLCAE